MSVGCMLGPGGSASASANWGGWCGTNPLTLCARGGYHDRRVVVRVAYGEEDAGST